MSNEFSKLIKHYLEDIDIGPDVKEEGTVLAVHDGVCTVYGFKKVFYGEVLIFPNEIKGICVTLDTSLIGVIILGDTSKIKTGFSVLRTYKQFEIPVGLELLGRVVNGFAQPIDGKGPLNSKEYSQIDSKTPNFTNLDIGDDTFYTGIKIIDSLLPIGKGYSELMIGDKQTGKTSLLLDCILNQSILNKGHQNKIYSIYVSIGQQISNVAKFVKQLEVTGAISSSCVVIAKASDEASSQYLAPFIGCTIGEYLRKIGLDAVVYYDTLSCHAVAYRQISLNVKKFPGIQSYPADMFNLHAKLLEKSGVFTQNKGGGSLTSIAVTETVANDLNSLIVQNLIAITDRQIFLDSKLLTQDIKPAINLNSSLNIISSKLQLAIIKKIIPYIKSDLAKYHSVKYIGSSSLNVDEEVNQIIHRGLIWLELFKQESNKPIPIELQAISLIAAYKGFYDAVPRKFIKICETELLSEANLLLNPILSKILLEGDLREDDEKKVTTFLHNFIVGFLSRNSLQNKII